MEIIRIIQKVGKQIKRNLIEKEWSDKFEALIVFHSIIFYKQRLHSLAQVKPIDKSKSTYWWK